MQKGIFSCPVKQFFIPAVSTIPWVTGKGWWNVLDQGFIESAWISDKRTIENLGPIFAQRILGSPDLGFFPQQNAGKEN